MFGNMIKSFYLYTLLNQLNDITMNEIKFNITALFLLSKIEVNGWTDMENKMKMQDQIMDKLEDLAKSNNTLLGRTMRFPMADSYSYYIITKVSKRTVKLEWIDYCDGWVEPRLGKSGCLDLSYVKETFEIKNKLDKLFGK
jgi:hypothetical protein